MSWPGRSFHVDVDQSVLDDLRDRLSRTRLPREQAGRDWATGTPIDYARRLRDYWLQIFDWRAWERRINTFEQRIVALDDIDIHVILKRGSGANPLPLLMTNGWPGSFLEFLDVIDRLAHPERFGGREEDAFMVVIPSLPGYGFSPPPAEPIPPDRIAGLWSFLMRKLGLMPYVAYGSDWGSLITARLALNHGEGLKAIQITSAGLFPTIDADTAPLTVEEEAWRHAAAERMRPESGYQIVQGTKPQSLAYGHTDSPIALACWIVEKFHGWTVPGSHEDPPFAMDDLIANVMLYWINGSVAPMWLYAFLGEVSAVPKGRRVLPPAGFLFSPRDLVLPPPRSWLERVYDVEHIRIAPEIGHFPGMDSPELLSSELQTFMRRFR